MRRSSLALAIALVPIATACSTAPPAESPRPPLTSPPGSASATGPTTPPAAASSSAPAASGQPRSTPSAATDLRADAPSIVADHGRAACQRGDRTGCDVLAEHGGALEMPPPALAQQLTVDADTLREACDGAKISSACMGYALMLKYGSATGKRDGEASKAYWGKVRQLGDLNGFRDGPSAEGKAALRRVLADCQAGRARACNQAGWAAYNAVQREFSIEDAFASYARACELGSPQGCRWAGHYAHVYAEVRDLARSEQLLTRSCDGGSPGGCDELGNFVGAERRDQARALSLHQKACSQGSRGGCAHAGEMLAASKSPADRERGVELVRASCEADDEDGCHALGALHETGGAGLKKDPTAAAAAFGRACQSKNERACEAIARVAGLGGAKTCSLDKVAKLDPKAARALEDACKKNPGAPWCAAVSPCAR